MQITQRFLDTLNDFKNYQGEDPLSLKDKDQSTRTLTVVDQFTSGSISQVECKKQLEELYETYDDISMSKTVTGHIIGEL